MPEPTSETLPLATEEDVVRVRQAVRRLAQGLGFSIVDQTKMVTAASELARNTVIYGGGGACDAEVLARDGRRGLRLTFRDDGPGIPDVAKAMTDGWTSGSGMGLGLPGAKRLVNDFEIDSAPGRGTRVTIARWK
ncbi:MAG TPA: anti-sigma regulatory factor [Humisphaera sp.]